MKLIYMQQEVIPLFSADPLGEHDREQVMMCSIRYVYADCADTCTVSVYALSWLHQEIQ